MTKPAVPKPTRAEGLKMLGIVPYSKLTTFKKDGTPVGVPIWQAAGDGKIWMFTEAKSWKVKRIRRNPRIEVGSSRVDLQACKLEYSIVSPK